MGRYFGSVDDEMSWLDQARRVREDRERVRQEFTANPEAAGALADRVTQLKAKFPGMPPGVYVAAAQSGLDDKAVGYVAQDWALVEEAKPGKSRWDNGGGVGGFLGDVGAAWNSADDAFNRDVVKQGTRFAAAALAYPYQVGMQAARGPSASDTGLGDVLWRATSLGQAVYDPGSTGTGYFVSGEAEQDRRTYEMRQAQGTLGGVITDDGERRIATPGRSLASAFHMDSDDGGGRLLSGAVDAFVMFKDPSPNILGRGASKLVRGSDTFSAAASAADDVGRARRLSTVGVIDGLVTRVHGPTAQAFLNSDRSTRWIDWLASNNDYLDLSRRMPTVPKRTLALISDISDPDEIRRLLDAELGITNDIIPTVRRSGIGGGFSYEAKRLASPRLQRYMSKLPGSFVDVDNPEDFAHHLELWGVNAELPVEDVGRIAKRAALSTNRQEAYDALEDAWTTTQRVLVDEGVDPHIARRVTSFFHEDGMAVGKAFVDDAGEDFAARQMIQVSDEMLATNPALGETIITDATGNARAIAVGDEIPLGDALIYNELLSQRVHLPDFRPIKQQIGAMRTISKARNAAVVKSSYAQVAGAVDGASGLWKKWTLMRFGFAVRNVAEQQAAMAAEGHASMFRHPLDYVSYVIGRKAAALEQDLLGGRWQDEIVDGAVVSEGDDIYLAATAESAHRTRQIKLDAQETTQGFTTYGRTDDNFGRAWSGEVAQLAVDPVANKVARAMRDGGRAVDDLKQAFWDGDLENYRRGLVRNTSLAEGEAPTLRHLIGTSRDASDQYIDTLVQRLRIKTGENPDVLGWIADGGMDVVRFESKAAKRAYMAEFSKAREADPSLTRVEFDEIFEAVHGRDGATWDGARRIRARLGDGKRPLPEMTERLRTLADDGVGPERVKGRVYYRPVGAEANRLQRAYDQTWDLLATEPSNRLGLHPAFKQIYADELARLHPYVDDAAQDAIDTYLPKGVQKGEGALPEGGVALTMEQADHIAKTNALEQMRRTFYELSERSQVGDSLRWLMPFADAWANGVRRWSRFVKEDPGLLRRGEQIMRGGQGAGFFTEDPTTGEMVFVYPGSQQLTRWATGVEWPMTGRLSGLNMVAQAYPGVGPGVQMAAAVALDTPLVKDIYTDPDWRWLRDIISPYGEPETQAGIIESLFPAWLGKARATGLIPGVGASKDQARVMANMKTDVMSYLMSKGGPEAYPQTEAGFEKLDRDASRAVASLGLLRSLAQFASPSAPSFDRKLTDKDGELVSLYAVTDDFAKMQDADYETAVTRFIEKWGINNLLAMQSKSVSEVIGLQPTAVMEQWEQQHGDEAADYPQVWGLFAPDGGAFDFAAFNAQLRSGDRTPIVTSPDDTEGSERIFAMAYSRIAEMKYAQARANVPAGTPRDVADAYLRQVREQLHVDFPYWRTITDEPTIRAENWQLVSQLRAATADPAFKTAPATPGLRHYFEARQQVIDFQRANGAESFGEDGHQLNTGQRFRAQIEWLYSSGEQLVGLYPEFARSWDQVLSREPAFDALGEV